MARVRVGVLVPRLVGGATTEGGRVRGRGSWRSLGGRSVRHPYDGRGRYRDGQWVESSAIRREGVSRSSLDPA